MLPFLLINLITFELSDTSYVTRNITLSISHKYTCRYLSYKLSIKSYYNFRNSICGLYFPSVIRGFLFLWYSIWGDEYSAWCVFRIMKGNILVPDLLLFKRNFLKFLFSDNI